MRSQNLTMKRMRSKEMTSAGVMLHLLSPRGWLIPSLSTDGVQISLAQKVVVQLRVFRPMYMIETVNFS